MRNQAKTPLWFNIAILFTLAALLVYMAPLLPQGWNFLVEWIQDAHTQTTPPPTAVPTPTTAWVADPPQPVAPQPQTIVVTVIVSQPDTQPTAVPAPTQSPQPTAEQPPTNEPKDYIPTPWPRPLTLEAFNMCQINCDVNPACIGYGVCPNE